METGLAIFAGIALSAATGFRVFVPLLAMSIAAKLGLIYFSSGFAWIGSFPALLAFAVATLVEIIGYYIPWVDNILDIIATPLTIIAGAVVMASFVSEMHPLLRWTLIIVAGSGTAGLVQGATVTARAVSTGTTGGIGNPILATAELICSVTLSVLTFILPVVAIGIALVIVFYLAAKFSQKLRRT